MPTLEEVAVAFESLASRFDATWKQISPNPSSRLIESSGWQYPAIAPQDVSDLAIELADRIRSSSDKDPSFEEAPNNISWLLKSANSVQFQNATSDPFAVFRSTVDFLLYCNTQVPPALNDLGWSAVAEKGLLPKEQIRRLTSLEATLSDLEPRIVDLGKKIGEIENAHQAAELLPIALEQVKAVNAKIDALLTSSTKETAHIEANRKFFDDTRKTIDSLLIEAQDALDRADNTFRVTTSKGLASAFSDRSRGLTRTAWIWVTVLTAALAIMVGIGFYRISEFESLLSNGAQPSVIFAHVVISAFGFGAPVWLAWLATKNIGSTFKLAEDYAFKASVSKAYEGYRSEAINLDVEFAKRLFGSALNRLDELPSRLEEAGHGASPLQELIASKQFQEILDRFPDAAQYLLRAAQSTIEQTSPASRIASLIPHGSKIRKKDTVEDEKVTNE